MATDIKTALEMIAQAEKAAGNVAGYEKVMNDVKDLGKGDIYSYDSVNGTTERYLGTTSLSKTLQGQNTGLQSSGYVVPSMGTTINTGNVSNMAFTAIAGILALKLLFD